MKQTALLAIIVGLSAVSMAAIYASDINPTSLAVATTSSDRVGMLGHVEFVQSDSFGNIIGYYQTDNFITDRGASCAAVRIFDSSNSGVADCLGVPGDFKYIAVGDQENSDAKNVTVLNGEIGLRKQDSNGIGIVAVGPNTGQDTVTVATVTPFTFGAGNSSANIFQAGLFDALTGGNVFAIQNTTGAPLNLGIDVNDGDTLNVTWTIIVG